MSETTLSRFSLIFSLLRVKQWSKNGFIFAALVFSHNLFHPDKLLATLQGFLAFSLAASAIYIINDCIDRERDRQHPKKRDRPIASGRIAIPTALFISLLCLAGFGLTAMTLPARFTLLTLFYILMQVFYSFKGKHMVILDALIISIGFVIRVAAGGFLITVPISSWLLLCTFFLALFLAFCKRYNELVTMEEAGNHRAVLDDYSLPFLNTMITSATSVTILTYALYVISPVTQEKFHSKALILTVPFVAYGIFRYLYLLYQRRLGGSPTEILFGDPPFILNLIAWIVTALLVVYTG